MALLGINAQQSLIDDWKKKENPTQHDDKQTFLKKNFYIFIQFKGDLVIWDLSPKFYENTKR